MRNERPRVAGGAVEDSWHDHSTAPLPADQGTEAVSIVPEALIAILTRLADALDRQADSRPRIEPLAYRLDELADALGVSRRAIERERAAGRFPRPDLTIGKMPLWRPETVRGWLDEGGGRR